VEVIRSSYPDNTALDKASPYFDEKSQQGSRWVCVDVKLKKRLRQPIPLTRLKEQTRLRDFTLLQRGNRLSVMPVSLSHWETILTLIEQA
jgi:predicted RNA-binding protein with PUA-like domain